MIDFQDSLSGLAAQEPARLICPAQAAADAALLAADYCKKADQDGRRHLKASASRPRSRRSRMKPSAAGRL